MPTFESAAREALHLKGITSPTTVEIRREMLAHHLGEAATLATLLGEAGVAKSIERIIRKIGEA